MIGLFGAGSFLILGGVLALLFSIVAPEFLSTGFQMIGAGVGAFLIFAALTKAS